MNSVGQWRFAVLAGPVARLCAATLLLACGASRADVQVLIGSSSAMSGPQAPNGQDQANGVRMAIDALNARHARIGGQLVHWRVDDQDDQADPRQAAIVAQKFVDEGVNAVVGHQSSGATFAALRIYAAAGIPTISPTATAPKLTRMGYANFFRMIPDDNGVARALARYAVNTLHAKTVAVLDDRSAFGQGLADTFTTAASQAGLRVLTREFSHDKAVDFSATLTKIKRLDPDLVFYGGVYAQGVPLLRQFRDLGLRGHVLGGDMMCMPTLGSRAGSSADVLICGDGGAPLGTTPGSLAWKKRYDARFGAASYQVNASFAYDATMVLAAAMLKADSIKPVKYLPYIRDIDIDGVTQSHIHFTSTGDVADPLITLSTFRGGVKTQLALQPAGN